MQIPKIRSNHAILIKTGSREFVVEEILRPKLDWFQQCVDGLIEPIHITLNGEPYLALVNEESLIRDMEYNELASHILNMTILGNVVIINPSDLD